MSETASAATVIGTVSPTLAINEVIARRRALGQETIALGFGEASIPVHPELRTRLARIADRGGYGPVAGAPELREAAAGYWTRRGVPTRESEVVAGPGTKPLLYAIFQALGGPVALPRPSWVSYAAQNALLGHEVEWIDTLPDHGGVPDPEKLADVAARRQRAGAPLTSVLVTIPDNPTGTIASPDVVRRLCAVARQHDLVVISDEIYLDLVHDDNRDVLVPGEVVPDLTITTTGLSKSLALGGWRIGTARFPDDTRGAAVQARVLNTASEVWSAPAHPVQLAAAWAYAEPRVLVDHIARSRRLHGRVADAVAGILVSRGARVSAPAGGFYVYPDFEPHRDHLARIHDVTTCDLLASVLLDRYGVATLPGSVFGDDRARLTLRMATPMLYGTSDNGRREAMESDDPASLPMISETLRSLDRALAALLDPPTPP